jgi:hypothetical protein
MTELYELSLFIFTRDLRLYDNTSLNAALKNSDKVIPIFILNPSQLSDKDNTYKSDNSVQFMMECLDELNKELKSHNSRLYYFYGETEDVVKKIIKYLDKKDMNLNAIFINKDYTPFAKKREASIQSLCKSNELDFICLEDYMLTGSKEVSLSFAPPTSNDRLTGFAGDGKTMTSRMLDGTFPPYRHLLPQEITTTALVEVATLLDSVRRVALVTDKTVPLRLDFNNNVLFLEAGAGEEAQATEAIDILLTGEPISIAFNPTFLADGLTAVGTKFVQISFTGSNKPAILMGKNDKDGGLIENYRYLLMPMRYAS